MTLIFPCCIGSFNSYRILYIASSIPLTCFHIIELGAQWLSGRVLDSRPKGRGLEPHRRHCVVSLSKNINLSLVLVQPRKTRPFITERILMGRKESKQTNKKYYRIIIIFKMELSSVHFISTKLHNSLIYGYLHV